MSRNRIATYSSLSRRFLLTFIAATVQLGVSWPAFAEETKGAPEASAGSSSSTAQTAPPAVKNDADANISSKSDDEPLHDFEKTTDPWKVNETRATEYRKTVDDCSKKLATNPDDIDALLNRSDAYLHVGTPEQVIDDANKVLSLNPKEIGDKRLAYCNRGEGRLRLKDYKLALEDFCKALEVDPNGDTGETYFFRGMAQERLGLLDLAMKDYVSAMDEGFSPTSPPAKPDFGPYMDILQRRIKNFWFPPKGEESKRITVTFKVNRQGLVSELKILKSSNVPRADGAAISAVRNSVPFASLPKGSPKVVDIEFTMDYNVFGKGRTPFKREDALASAKHYQERYGAAVKAGDIKKQKAMLIAGGEVEVDLKQYDSALTKYKSALALIVKTGNDRTENAKLLNRIALAYAAQGKKSEAEAKFKESVALANQVNQQVFQWELKPVYIDYADFLCRNNRRIEAQKYYDYFSSKK